MSDIRVSGFNDIIFWQEDGIGIVVIRTNEKGLARRNFINEIIMALTTASTDDAVRSVAITGINNNFLSGMMDEPRTGQELLDFMNSTSTFLSVLYSIGKPVYSILSGDSLDIGREISLATDIIMASDRAMVGYSDGYKFRAGGSITSLRFPMLGVSAAEEHRNVDIVYPGNTLLDSAKKFILSDMGYSRHLMRRTRLRDMRISLLEEREELILRDISSGDQTKA
ncbi:MAG: enoyl-CoA hydratase-related protein [Thermoplasmata archaeon]